MTDFAVLPPEVTSARMYAGVGSGPLVAAAAGWDRLAAALGSASGSYGSVVSGLVDESWQGPASGVMAAAVQPYVAWMSVTAARAGVAASQARSAAAAFEVARAAVVPPEVVAANRSVLSSLVAGNVLGQNSGAIAANQAEYSVMWAQDAAAMQAYAASSSAAAQSLSAFDEPPQIAGSAADEGETQSVTLTSLAQQILQTAPVQALNGFLNSVDSFDQNILVGGLLDGFIQYSFIVPQIVGAETAAISYGTANGMIGGASAVSAVSEDATPLKLARSASAGAGAAGGGAPAAGGVTAGMGRATPVGALSTPAAWAPATRGVRLAVSALPLNGTATPGISGGWLGGIPPIAGVVNAPSETAGRSPSDPSAKVVPALARPGGADGESRLQTAVPGDGAIAAAAPSGRRAELARLRKLAGDLTKERDVLEQSAETLLELAGVRPDGRRR